MKWFWEKKETPPEVTEIKSSNDVWSSSYMNSRVSFSSAITAILAWVSRNIGEADLVSERYVNDAWVDETLPKQLNYLLPNSKQTLLNKISATACDISLYGNAVWLKLRNGRKLLTGFQYIPWDNVRVDISKDNTYIESYTINNVPYAPSEIIHFKLGSQVGNPLLGLDVWSALQEHNQADIEGSLFVTGIISSPSPKQILFLKPDNNGKKPNLTQDAIDRIARRVAASSKASRPGDYPLLDTPIEAIPNGFTPKDMLITELQDYTETRICALFGLPTQVVGLSSGANPTYSNFQEAQRIATVNFLVPMWRIISEAISQQAPELWVGECRLRFKYEETAAMQLDLNAESDRVGKLYQAGVIDKYTAQATLGLDPPDTYKGVWYNTP